MTTDLYNYVVNTTWKIMLTQLKNEVKKTKTWGSLVKSLGEFQIDRVTMTHKNTGKCASQKKGEHRLRSLFNETQNQTDIEKNE